MNSHEFIITEDSVFDILEQFNLEELSKNAVNRIFENSNNTLELENFINSAHVIPQLFNTDIGKLFFPIGISANPDSKFLSLAHFTGDSILAEVTVDGIYVFNFDGKKQSFPSTKENQMRYRLIFSSLPDYSKFETMLLLKFSTWNIKKKIL